MDAATMKTGLLTSNFNHYLSCGSSFSSLKDFLVRDLADLLSGNG